MKELVSFSHMAHALSSRPFREALSAAARAGAEITGCIRCCVIIENKHKKLVLKAGYPETDHGIGQEIAPEYGGDFLRHVMNDYRRAVLVRNPAHDPRTAYLKDLALHYHIASILFVPLLAQEEAIGVMVFDFASSEKIPVDTAKLITSFVAAQIETFRQKEKEKKKEEQREKICFLGEKYILVAHNVRNSLMAIGGHARRLARIHAKNKDIAHCAPLIAQEVSRLEYVMKNILALPEYSPRYCAPSAGNMHEFITTLLKSVREKYPSLHTHFIRTNGHDIMVRFDKRMMHDCLSDLVMNAQEAGARNIWIKIKMRAAKKMVLISVANDGRPIAKEDLENIFDPFFTTKTSGGGIGLALAQTIIESHGGTISAHSIVKKRNGKSGNPHRTIFRIHLPL